VLKPSVVVLKGLHYHTRHFKHCCHFKIDFCKFAIYKMMTYQHIDEKFSAMLGYEDI